MVFEAVTDDEVRALFPVISQLRPQLSGPDDLLERATRMRGDGYRIVWRAGEDGTPVAFAGFRIYETLYAGLKLYVDDLVTTEARRGKGDGTVLIDWLLREARARGCQELDLDSGVQRFAAHGFYFARGLHIASYHFKRSV
ncbi:GNAT family N-acetyltransferase [Zavarzinia compransoris]|uniref:GNAT family N-acetyltransferase n=2 Tax=Zavarzinia compransoris TaxID=1264899 RepID=A0A317EAB6_9PROT|nr:GNAT family N-acetyltransferase [Zavarzinia compransoris]